MSEKSRLECTERLAAFTPSTPWENDQNGKLRDANFVQGKTSIHDIPQMHTAGLGRALRK